MAGGSIYTPQPGIDDKKFAGHGDPRKLREILQRFRDWVGGNQG